SGSNPGHAGGNARHPPDLRTATPKRIHRWSWCCPITAETRSWCAFETITSSQNAGAEIAPSSIDCTGALCGPEYRAGTLPAGTGFAGAAEQTTSLFEV